MRPMKLEKHHSNKPSMKGMNETTNYGKEYCQNALARSLQTSTWPSVWLLATDTR